MCVEIINFYVVIVLYNKSVDESISFRHLVNLPLKNIHIIIIDNSSSQYLKINEDKCKELQIQYHSMGGNVGLSKAYNYALTLLKEGNSDDIIIWFDDDTPVEKNYFDILMQQCVNTKIDVFVPIIYGQNGIIYSPNEAGFLKGKYIKSPDQKIRIDKFNAINSCLAVRLRVYKNYSYDEILFMDCVDSKLFDDFRKMNLTFSILPIEIHQNFFQRSDNIDVEIFWKRFHIRIKDTYNYYSLGGKIKKLSGIIKIIGWAVLYGIKLKSIWFFWNCIILMCNLLFLDNGGKKYEG